MRTKNLTRKRFLELGAGFIGLSALPLVLGCPADDGDDDDDDDGGCESAPDVTIAGNHGHVLVVPLADVLAGTRASYDIRGSATHPHTVVLTAADFAMLRQGEEVTVRSSFDDGHDHSITVRCA